LIPGTRNRETRPSNAIRVSPARGVVDLAVLSQ
jgi:hypothetical protein